jgi:hypothetical protein
VGLLKTDLIESCAQQRTAVHLIAKRAHRDLIVEDYFMAKALLGHLAGTDPRVTRETWLLRQRVADLEAEVARLKSENDALVANYPDAETLTPERLVDFEPALG